MDTSTYPICQIRTCANACEQVKRHIHYKNDEGSIGFGGNVSGTFMPLKKPQIMKSPFVLSINNEQQETETPTPESKPNKVQDILNSNDPIINGVDNKTLKEEIIGHEGDTQYLYKDTAKGGGKVTVGNGIMLPNVEAAKKLPFEIGDGKGNYRKATPDEIERACANSYAKT